MRWLESICVLVLEFRAHTVPMIGENPQGTMSNQMSNPSVLAEQQSQEPRAPGSCMPGGLHCGLLPFPREPWNLGEQDDALGHGECFCHQARAPGYRGLGCTCVSHTGWLASSGPRSHGLFLALITVPMSLCGFIFLRPCCASPLVTGEVFPGRYICMYVR